MGLHNSAKQTQTKASVNNFLILSQQTLHESSTEVFYMLFLSLPVLKS